MEAFETHYSEPPTSCCVLNAGGAGWLSGDLVDWFGGICSNGKKPYISVLFIAHPRHRDTVLLARRPSVRLNTDAGASETQGIGILIALLS